MSPHHRISSNSGLDDDLRAIFSELLVLGATESIPSPASQRTWTFIMWILSVQNLPPAVLSSVKREIASVIKRAIEGQMGTDQAKLNGIKVVRLLWDSNVR